MYKHIRMPEWRDGQPICANSSCSNELKINARVLEENGLYFCSEDCVFFKRAKLNGSNAEVLSILRRDTHGNESVFNISCDEVLALVDALKQSIRNHCGDDCKMFCSTCSPARDLLIAIEKRNE